MGDFYLMACVLVFREWIQGAPEITGVLVLIFKQEETFLMYFLVYLTHLSAFHIIRVSLKL